MGGVRKRGKRAVEVEGRIVTNLFFIISLAFSPNQREMTLTYYTPQAGRITVQTQCDRQGYWDNSANLLTVAGTNTVTLLRPRCEAAMVRLKLEIP